MACLPRCRKRKNPWRLEAEKREPRDGEADTSIFQDFDWRPLLPRDPQDSLPSLSFSRRKGNRSSSVVVVPSASFSTKTKGMLIGRSCSDFVTEHSVLLSALLFFFFLLWVVVVTVVVCSLFPILCALPHTLTLCCSPFPFPFLFPLLHSSIQQQKAYHPPKPSAKLSALSIYQKEGLDYHLPSPHTHPQRTGLLLLFAALHWGPLWILPRIP